MTFLEPLLTICESLLDQAEDTEITAIPFSCGLKSLDEALGGLWAGDMVVLDAPAAAASTQLALAMMFNIASLWQGKVILLSLRKSRRQLLKQVLCERCSITPERFDANSLSAEEKSALRATLHQFDQQRIYVCDSPELDPDALIAEISRFLMLDSSRVQVVIVDGAEHLYENRRRRGSAAEMLHELSKTLQTPVVALMSVNPSTVSAYQELSRDAKILMSLRQEPVLGLGMAGCSAIEVLKHPRRTPSLVVLRPGELNERWTF